MADYFIFHGVGGHPEENWFPWLKDELEKQGGRVFIPQFPTPENQTLDKWLEVLERYGDRLSGDSVLIGHSLGVPFALNVIERYPVKAAYFVAGFTGVAGNDFDESMKTFAQREFNWDKIRNNCKEFFVFHSDNDPYISLEKGEKLASDLNTDLIMVKEGGHLNESAGFTKFQLLLNKINEKNL